MVAKALWFAEPSGQPPPQQQQQQQDTAAHPITAAAARPSLSPMLASAPPPDGEASEWITTRGGGGGSGTARRAPCGLHSDAGAGGPVGTPNGGLGGQAACGNATPLSTGHRESSGGSSWGQGHGRGSNSQLDGLPGRPPLPHGHGGCTGASMPHGEGHAALPHTQPQQQQQPSHRSSTSLLDDSPVGPQGISAAAVATATTDMTDDDVVEVVGAAAAGGTCANGGRRGSSSRSDFAFDTPAGGDDTPDLIARDTPQGPPAIASSTAKDPGAPLQQEQPATREPNGGQAAAAAAGTAAAAAAAFRPAAFRAGVKRGLPASLGVQAAKRPATNPAVGPNQPLGQAHAAPPAAAAAPAVQQDVGPVTRAQVLKLIEQQGPVTAPSLVQQLCGAGAEAGPGAPGAGACPRRLGQLQAVLQELVGEFEVMRKGEGSRRSEVVLEDQGTTYEVL